MNKALLILCYTADTPHRTGSQETVRWLGSELVGDTRRTGSQETVRWLGSELVGDTRRTGSQETVRWLGSEHSRAHHPNRLARDCEVAWLWFYLL